jgi:acyl carrier protein
VGIDAERGVLMGTIESIQLDTEELRGIVANVAELEPAEVTDDALFTADLGIDSLTALEVVIRLEHRYGVKFDESRLDELTCFAAVRELMLRKLASR